MVISYQELTGSYNFGKFGSYVPSVISYQELTGSYNKHGKLPYVNYVISYQELIVANILYHNKILL